MCFHVLLPSYGKYWLGYNLSVFVCHNSKLYKQLEIHLQPQRRCLSHRSAPTTTAWLLRTGASSGWFRAPSLHNVVPWFGLDGTQNNPPKPCRGLWSLTVTATWHSLLHKVRGGEGGDALLGYPSLHRDRGDRFSPQLTHLLVKSHPNISKALLQSPNQVISCSHKVILGRYHPRPRLQLHWSNPIPWLDFFFIIAEELC